ncbi:MAG TPA: alpha/beta fold hydrolase, partial [Burkholderiales bacterium]|nr:alpha/beta fold hydrolase [Burkholderiales bacterium]
MSPSIPYRAPWWLPGRHAQTLYGVLFARARIAWKRERWDTPDGDFIDVDRLPGAPGAPLVVLFHGLEGSSSSHYALALARELRRRAWGGAIAHFRGCSGEANRLPRAYHSGDSAEIRWILRRFSAASRDAPLFAAGVSLGGNALLKWLGEDAEAKNVVAAAAAISAPVDLMAAGAALERGFNLVYTRAFL